MITIDNASKSFYGKNAIENCSFSIEKGSIFGLIGPNGAGKTTIIKAILDIYKLDKGEIKIDGELIDDNSLIKAKIGYVADENKYFTSYKIKEILKFYKMTYKDFDESRFYELNEILKLPLDRSIGRLSKGMKMRLSFMLNLSIRPEILIMDEPTSGLDPIVRKQVVDILLEEAYDRQTTILISSHNLGELERICDTVAIMNDGKIEYINSIDEMKNSLFKIQVAFDEEIDEDFNNWKEVIKVEKMGRMYTLITKNNSEEFMIKLNSLGMVFSQEINLSLEDIFIYYISENVNLDFIAEDEVKI
ncbi:MAG: ABC transporter ATP-binding protein [Clostridiaceae bacterium]